MQVGEEERCEKTVQEPGKLPDVSSSRSRLEQRTQNSRDARSDLVWASR